MLPRFRNRLPRPQIETLEERTVPAVALYSSAEFVDLLPGQTVVAELMIDDTVTIQDLDVRIDLNTFTNDEVTAFLVSPDGTRVQLFSRSTPEGDTFTDAIFDDEAGQDLPVVPELFSERFRASEALSAFDGENLAGTWRLEVTTAATLEERLGEIGEFSLLATIDRTRQVYESVDVPIFTEEINTVVSTIFVPDNFRIADVDVTIDLEHSAISDLEIVLVAPSGQSVRLFSGEDQSGQNLTGTTFDDAAAESIDRGSAPFTGRFRPLDLLGLLTFDSAGGNWELQIGDFGDEGSGVLNSWSLSILPRLGEPLPDVLGSSFRILEERAFWGDTVTVEYSIRNNELPLATNFQIEIVLSADGVIDDNDLVLTQIPIDLVFPTTPLTGITRVRLPGSPLTTPSGFTLPDEVTLGLRINPSRLLIESEFDNNANLGLGIDSARLRINDTPGAITGRIFDDLNADGIRDPNEAVLSNIKVFLDANSNGRLDAGEMTTLTDATGQYRFDTLLPGVYRVMVLPRSGEVISTPLAVADDVRYQADFSQGDEGFTSTGNNNLWNLSNARGRDSFYFGVPGTGYLEDSDGTLFSPQIQLEDRAGLVFSFDYFLEYEEGFDVATVGIRVDGVETILTSTDAIAPLLRNTPTGFQNLRFDLSRFAGQTVQFFFRFNSDNGGEFEGWYIADPQVLVVGGARYLVELSDEDQSGLDFGLHRPVDLIGTGFVLDQNLVTWGDTVNVDYQISNRGTLPSAGFDVALRLSSDSVIDENDLLLETIRIDGLAALGSFSGTVSLMLPGTAFEAPFGFESGSFFIGAMIDSQREVVEFRENNNSGEGPNRDRAALKIETATAEVTTNETLSEAQMIQLPTIYLGEFSSPSDIDFLRFEVLENGRLIASAQSLTGIDPIIQLLDNTGRVLIESRQASPTDLSPLIDQHLTPGEYLLAVRAGSATSSGSYRFQVDFDSSLNPLRRVGVDVLNPIGLPGMATFNAFIPGDFNNDGQLDLFAVSNRGLLGIESSDLVFLGQTDGSFAAPLIAESIAEATDQLIDINGDGKLDLFGNDARDRRGIFVQLGRGDGTFEAPIAQNQPNDFRDFLIVDLDGDGRVDLIGSNFTGDAIQVLYGNGDGTFLDPIEFEVELPMNNGLTGLADFNGDGRLDLLLALSEFTRGGGVALSNPDGTFQPIQDFDTRGPLQAIVTADFDQDGNLDLVFTSAFERGARMKLGNGDGTFGESIRIEPDLFFQSLNTTDLNQDGRVDLIVSIADARSGTGVFLSNGDGSFQQIRRFNEGLNFSSARLLDFNGDGALDLFDELSGTNGANLSFGNGDGTFRALVSASVLAGLTELRTADFNGDGQLDLLGGNGGGTQPGRFGARVVLGNGDGTFSDPVSFGAPGNFFNLQIADLDRDGRLDIAGVNGAGGVVVLLGNGDGTFRPPTFFGSNFRLASMQVVDLNGDGFLDLVSGQITPFTSPETGTRGLVSFLGNGNGTFAEGIVSGQGASPNEIRVGDLNGDQIPDAVVAVGIASARNGLAILIGRGDGTFNAPVISNTNFDFDDLELLDIDQDGNLDLVSGRPLRLGGNLTPGVSIFYGLGNGTFESPIFLNGIDEQTTGDFNGDGLIDVVGRATDAPSAQLVLYRNLGFRNFDATDFSPIDIGVFDPIAGDFNSDGKLDVVSNGAFSSLLVGLGDGEGAFLPAPRRNTVPKRAVPLRADLDQDGITDLIVASAAGDVLYRRGLPGVNLFEPATVVNPSLEALDVAILRTPTGLAIATSDKGGGMSIYSLVGDRFSRTAIPQATEISVRLRATDLNGDGLDDLVNSDRNKSILTVYYQNADGTFGDPIQLPVGTGTNGIIFGDVDGRDGIDILTVNRSSGDVSVFYNDPSGQFVESTRFRTGTSLIGLETILDTVHPVSSEEPVGVAFGDFTGDGINDLLIAAREARELRVLVGLPQGGFANPNEAFSTPFGFAVSPEAQTGQLISADFNNDGRLDAALVAEGTNQVLIFLSNGDGTFELSQAANAGNAPTGMSFDQLNDDNGDGRIDRFDSLDLLIGNGFGDVLTLLGNGDGTFRSFVRSDQRVPFVATDLNNDGVLDVVLAQQATDQASSNLRVAGTQSFSPGAFQRDANDGLIGPGDIEIRDLDGRFGDDLIFANTGSNNILVYLRRADGSFDESPLSFFAGSSPTDLHLTDLNGDGLIDLVVANQGSNDVSVLFGNRTQDVNQDGSVDNLDLFRLGPRLNTGGQGPNGVTTMDVTGDGVLDILATNGRSGTISMLPGVGSGGVGTGSFIDTNPTQLALSAAGIDQTLILPGMGLVVTGNGSLMAFNPLTGASLGSFDGQGIRSIDALQNGAQTVIFALGQNGIGSVLQNIGNGFSLLNSFVTNLTNPSDVQAFNTADGRFELFITDSTLNTPIIMTIDPFLPVIDPGFFPLPIVPPTAGGPFVPGVTFTTTGEIANGNPFVLVVVLTSTLSDDFANNPANEVIEGIDPFGSEGSAFGDDEFGLAEDGTILSSGALALVKIGTEDPPEEPGPGLKERENLNQFISGFQDEIKKLLAEIEAPPAPPKAEKEEAKEQPPETPVSPQEEEKKEALPLPADEVQIPEPEKTEVSPQSELEEPNDIAPSGALILTGAFLGNYLSGVWYRPTRSRRELRTEKR